MIREIGRVALRLAGAGVVGTAIGAVARRAPLTDLMDRTIDPVIDGARAIGALPVWETAGRLGVALPSEMVPVVALCVLALALAAVAAHLWRRTPRDGSSPSPLALDLTALAALPRRMARRHMARRHMAQRRAAPERAGLVPTLAATGVDRAEIARRTGLSRDAVALSLNLAARQV